MIPGGQNPFSSPRFEEWAAQYGEIASALFAGSMGDHLLHAFLADIGADLGQLTIAWQQQPEALIALQQDWLARVGDITTRYGGGYSGDDEQTAVAGSHELHAALGGVVERYVSDAPTEDRRLKDRLGVASRLWVSALSPDNFLFSNPAAMDEAARSHGESIDRGLQNLRADLGESRAGLRVRSAEADGFKPGESLAVSPGEVVYQNELFQLIQYYPAGAEVHKVPLLIIPPWINKFYILDLTPATSLVRWLVQQGYTVFMISWVNPGAALADTAFEDYLGRGCLPALAAIRDISGENQIDVMGYCIGGVLAACLAAWLAAGAGVAADDVSLNTLTLLNTLLDYSDPGGVDLYTSANMLAAIEQKVTDAGYLDGSIMSVAFSLLRAERNYWPQFVHNYLKGQAPKRDPLSFWNFDVTNLPARMTLDFLHDFYRDNRLARPDELELYGRKLDLSQIDCPTIAVACERDHLVPWRAAYSSAGLIGDSPQFILAQGGHVTGIIRPPGGQEGIGEEEAAKHQASYRQLPLAGNSSEWKGAAEVRSGSWWPGWDEAMAQYHGPKVPARFPGGPGQAALEPSPGSYVLAEPEA